MDEWSRHRQFEDRFLRQLQARAQALLRHPLPADRVQIESLPDGSDAVRATLTRLRRFDRDLLEQLPGTRAVQLRFRRRVFGPLARTAATLRAQVLAPIERLVQGGGAGPVGREEVLDALARYELLPQRERPSAAVFASATGFTPEAKALVHAGGRPLVVLLGGRDDGGWDVEVPAAVRQGPWAGLFEFESQDERLRRLLYHLDKEARQLESRGIALPELAERLGLPVGQVEGLVRQACRLDSRLMTIVHDGTIHIGRSPLAEASEPMSLRSWMQNVVRKLLRRGPTVAEQVRALTAQRVRLEQERHEVDQRLTTLEAEEREIVARGAAAQTDVERKQLAGRLMRARRDLRRLRAQANVFTQQIDILGTHIHHLTLAEQGKRIELPKAEELTRQAAEAEQMMAELAANADLAAGIEVGATTPLMQEEEAAILDEFKQAAQQAASAAPAPAGEGVPSAASQRTPARESPAPAPPADKGKARPEMT